MGVHPQPNQMKVLLINKGEVFPQKPTGVFSSFLQKSDFDLCLTLNEWSLILVLWYACFSI